MSSNQEHKPDPPNMVFKLLEDTYSSSVAGKAALDDPRNDRWRWDKKKSALAVTLDGKRSDANILLKLGNTDNDDIFVSAPGVARCHFVFNPESGELLLRDDSDECTATLFLEEPDTIRIKQKGDRQCAIVLDQSTSNYPRVYVLRVADGISFNLHLPPEPIALQKKKPFFCREDWQVKWENEPNDGNSEASQPTPKHVKHIRVRHLGSGYEGAVDAVADLRTGQHFACKTLRLDNTRERQDRALDYLKLLKHDRPRVERHHIVPCFGYNHLGSDRIEMFMPIYWCSLRDLILGNLFANPETAMDMAVYMVRDISDALSFLAKGKKSSGNKPAHLHRDVKPENILYLDKKFALADFGISKTMNQTYTNVGTPYFQAPEIADGKDQTPALDIYSLGLTLAACLSCEHYLELGRDEWVENAERTLQKSSTATWDVHRMLEKEPTIRPYAHEVKEKAEAYLVNNAARNAARDILPGMDATKSYAQTGQEAFRHKRESSTNQYVGGFGTTSTYSSTSPSTVPSAASPASPASTTATDHSDLKVLTQPEKSAALQDTAEPPRGSPPTNTATSRDELPPLPLQCTSFDDCHSSGCEANISRDVEDETNGTERLSDRRGVLGLAGKVKKLFHIGDKAQRDRNS